jgi:Fe-S-cluster containining protein
MDVSKPDGSALCASCGFCCDGTLFDQARAEADELGRLAAAGMEVYHDRGKDRFRQPCPAFDGTCCSIYASRFAICRSFRCALLRRFEAGEADLDQALATVAAAKALLARIEARSPGSRPRRARRALEAEMLAEARSGDPEAGRFYLDLVALEELLETRFRNPKKDDPES